MPSYPSLRSLRRVALLASAALALAASPAATNAAGILRQTSLNGTLYAVVSPIFDGSTGTESYLRLFNGASTTTTFGITIIDADTGGTVGNPINITVAKNASPQYPVTPTGGGNSIFAMAAATDNPGTNYALYIQSSSNLAGYQHVTYNTTSGLFENLSTCNTLLDSQLATVSNSEVLTNVHTSALGGGTTYPSTITIHNTWNSQLTFRFSVIDAAAGGSFVGNQFTESVGANATVTLPESQIESLANFHPNSSQLHINLIVSDISGNPPYEMLTHTVAATQYGGVVDMTTACAVQAVASSSGTTGVPGGLNGY